MRGLIVLVLLLIGMSNVSSAIYKNFVVYDKNIKLKLPTEHELMKFIRKDRTDKFEYDADTFDCTEFANLFIRNFAWNGYFACTSELTLYDEHTNKTYGHIIVAVETKEGELYYVEPQIDKILKSSQIDVGKKYCFDEKDCDVIIKVSDCFRLEGSDDWKEVLG